VSACAARVQCWDRATASHVEHDVRRAAGEAAGELVPAGAAASPQARSGARLRGHAARRAVAFERRRTRTAAR